MTKAERMRAGLCVHCGCTPPRTAKDGTRMLYCEPCAAQTAAERVARYVGRDPKDEGLRARHRALGRCANTIDIETAIDRRMT